MMPDDEAGSHPERAAKAFFGRRHGKRLRAQQSDQLDHLLPQLMVDLEQTAPADLTSLFGAKVDSVHLEIGFGGGEHLISHLRRRADTGFIGVEPFVNGMAKLVSAVTEADCEHLRLYNEDATELLDWLPSASLDGIDLFYPDPWHKKRHWKRRFVSMDNLDRFARVLKPGALFRFASDIEHYVNWTLQHCDCHSSFEWISAGPEDWRDPYEAWPGTRYEAKALREGRTPAYLRFKRI